MVDNIIEFPHMPRERRMYERSYGDKYDSEMSVKDIAAAIRVEIRKRFPELKTSVRYKSFSGGSSITVTIKEAPFRITNARRVELAFLQKLEGFDRDRHEELNRINWITDEAIAVERAIERLMSEYNHDGSELQADYHDVKFYKSVTFDWHVQAAEEEYVHEMIKKGARNIRWK